MTKPKKDWKYGLVQHPMWLLIDEDTVCAERTPPWGAPSLADYVQRLEEGMQSMDKFPELHVNFDFSAVELEDMAQRYPKLTDQMRNYTAKGRVSFVNGTYSQPHLQILSIESAIRQLQYGLQAIEKLVGYRVTCYAAQEPGFSPQLPQILRALGYKTSTTSSFPSGVRLENGQVQHWDRRWEWLAGDDLVNWKSLDGTTIPLWLKIGGKPDEFALGDEVQHGSLPHTRLRVEMPDMMDITPEWFEIIDRACEFVQLDKTLEDLFEKYRPAAIAYIDANYAYTEGADAEDLSKANVRAESALLSLESLTTFVPAARQFNWDAAWKVFMKAQHHDSYWIGAPELRAKSIAWLDDVTRNAADGIADVAGSIARGLAAVPDGSGAILALHPYARKHSAPVEVRIGDKNIVVSDDKGRKIPVQTQPNSDGSANAVFVSSAKGLGYQTFFSKSTDRSAASQKSIRKPYKFSNGYYSINVRPDGTIASLAPRRGAELLTKDAGIGGNFWLYQQDGSDVTPKSAGDVKLTQGPVFDLLETSAQVGVAKLTHKLSLYKALPWFTVETEVQFDEPTEIGDYFNDRTKLHHAWPIGRDVAIRHAIGGAPAEARHCRSFLVSPWLDLAGPKSGLAMTMFNAAKCWLDEEGVLRCLAAWGHDGDHFHNRQGPLKKIMGALNWLKPMDLRLNGKYTFKYAVWPHAAKVTEAEIADWAASLLMAPVAHTIATGNGQNPWAETFLSVGTSGLIPLSVRTDGDDAVLRAVDMSGRTQSLKLDMGSRKLKELRNLDGTKAKKIAPHKIVEARIGR